MGKKIKNFEKLQGYDFEKHARNEGSGAVKIKLLALSHIQDNKNTIKKVAMMMKVCEKSIRNWVDRFVENGFDGLHRQSGQGSKKRVCKKNYPEIKKGILSLQKDRVGGRVRGEDVKEYLLTQYGISYKLSAVYNLLHDLGIVWISARSKHPASNQEEQNAFKKTSLIASKNVFRKEPI